MYKYFALFALLVAVVTASSHSEAPGTAKIPNADITDLYAFRSYETGRSNFVTFIMNVYPLQSPFGGPNYYALSENHFYELNIDLNHDAVQDVIFQFYYGNRLGGSNQGTFQIANPDPCSDEPLVNQTTHEGITITVQNPSGVGDQTAHSIAIPLKFAGGVANVTDANLNWFEWYFINYIQGDRSAQNDSQPITKAGTATTKFEKPFDYAGTKTFSNYTAYAEKFYHNIDIPGCGTEGRVFVGQRAESFAVNLGKIFDLVNLVPVELGTFTDSPDVGIAQCDSNNDLSDKNVISFVLEVPISCLAADDDIIGVWATTRELKHVGDEHIPGKQVSRLGQPLVNEVVIGLRDKAVFSAVQPTEDVQFLDYVQYPTLPEIIDLLFLETIQTLTGLGDGLKTVAPTIPRTDLVTLFLKGVPGTNQPSGVTASEMLRLNLSVAVTAPADQSALGVLGGDSAGFPNGRRPGDDVVDIALDAVMGRLCTLGLPRDVFGCNSTDAPLGTVSFTDGAPQSASQFGTKFPYLNVPYPGATTDENANVCPGQEPSSSLADEGDGSDTDGSAATTLSSFLFSFL